MLCSSMSSFSFTPLNQAPPQSLFPSLLQLSTSSTTFAPVPALRRRNARPPTTILCCSNSNSSSPAVAAAAPAPVVGPPVLKKRKRYRKSFPGENQGITQEMRFVAMRLRNIKGHYTHMKSSVLPDDESQEEGSEGESETWVPSMEGFVKYLVASKLVFSTVERILDNSDDVSYTHFRRNGLERSEALANDLEWLSEKYGIEIPQPSNQGVVYATYLEEIAKESAPLFLSHLYNIYFCHIAGGRVIANRVCDQLLEGKELEFLQWEGDAQELLKGVREKLNMIGEGRIMVSPVKFQRAIIDEYASPVS